MPYIRREIEEQVLKAAKFFPALVLTGPRRSGKTWLLQHLFPKAEFQLFEDPDIVSRFRADPHGFLDALRTPAILDEVQNIPEIFNYVRARIDREPRRAGRWFLTGSQEAPLMRRVTESMAGRAALLQLLPLSVRESSKVGWLNGGYPEVITAPKYVREWFSSYLQTYLERDVRAVTAVRDLAVFRRFLALLATRTGQVLNRADLASSLGVTIPTISNWLDVLEITQQVFFVPPYFENLGKRLIKSPKVYFADNGLACHLLGVETVEELERSTYLGPLFEGFVAGEIVKAQVNSGRRRELYYFRDQRGLEVDFLVPGKSGRARLIEVKATRTPLPSMAESMRKLREALAARRPHPVKAECLLVHRPPKVPHRTTALSPGIQAMDWNEFVREPLGRGV